ncbi:DNA-3-methyladenine glycosylase 2 family protein [Sulfitobacter sp. PR48]|uniref:DNA-3-methyladenine glycosylase family protein n=1 Tax=Sulfitobacter sp. PR48 TaxID=3028383 RepID=UPI00237B1553|nr:DNA-3-methyladenine glycosylase 2 family protein [Sulfitobacter sp. PR48]MDD9723242.1 DNA-3-methyladenine glycosylase 2 family protein [Sulfitobacter sp. PR48]
MSDTGGIIRNAADLQAGAAWLATHEPRFAPVLAATGPLPLRLKPPGFAALMEIIVSQQVSVASANAIRARLAAAGLSDAAAIRAVDEPALTATGLSRPKARYVSALAHADIDFDALGKMTNAGAEAALIAQKGIGPWTAQIYVMFAMGRADGFAPGDLALQEAARVVFDLPQRPTADQLAAMAQNWSPWRSVAARALFAYYRVLKNREGLG